MAITFDQYDSTLRPHIKAMFGNRRNWHRFLAIAVSIEAELSLRYL